MGKDDLADQVGRKTAKAHMQLLLAEACIIVDDPRATGHAYRAVRHLTDAASRILRDLGHEMPDSSRER